MSSAGWKTLYEEKSLAPNDYKKFETAYTNSQQQYAQAQKGAQQEDKAAAKAALEQSRGRGTHRAKAVSDSTLIAPISGFVSKRNIEVGAMASPGTATFTIVELDPVENPSRHSGNRYPPDSSRPKGDHHGLCLSGDELFGAGPTGKCLREPQTRTYMARIRVPNGRPSFWSG